MVESHGGSPGLLGTFLVRTDFLGWLVVSMVLYFHIINYIYAYN